MGIVSQIGVGVVVVGAAFVFGHYVNQNSMSRDPFLDQSQEQDEIVWQSNQTLHELRSRLGESTPNGDQASTSTIPGSSMPIAGVNGTPVVRKPNEGPATPSLTNPFGEPDSLQPAPFVPPVLPPVNGTAMEKRIIQPDFSELAAAAETKKLLDQLDTNAESNAAPLNTLPNVGAIQPLPSQQPLPANTANEANEFQGSWVTQPTTLADALPNTSAPLPDANTATLPLGSVLPPVANPLAPSLNSAANPLPILPPVPTNDLAHTQSAPISPSDSASTSTTALKPIDNRKIAIDPNSFLTYRSKLGDSLQSISIKYFGKPDYYLDIYLANRTLLSNPATVPTGVDLRIPVYKD